KLLAQVHAHEIFEDGVYNSDPHAGNVIIMDDGRLGLIDYGAGARMTIEQRRNFAHLLIAISEYHEDDIIYWMQKVGISSKKLDRVYMLAYGLLCFHRGYNEEDMRKVGIPKEIGVMDLDAYLNDLDKLEHFQKH